MHISTYLLILFILIQLIQLKSQYDLLPGSVTPLNIVVPQERLSLYGNAIPTLRSISTLNVSRVYGAGDLFIYIYLCASVNVCIYI
jgi:hypothetical protein